MQISLDKTAESENPLRGKIPGRVLNIKTYDISGKKVAVSNPRLCLLQVWFISIPA